MVIDTNIGLRYLLRDNEESFLKVNSIFESEENIILTDMVIAEMVYVMRGANYCKSRHQVSAAIRIMLKNNNVENPSNLADRYLALYDETSIDLVDCYLIIYALEKSEGLNTFDNKMKKVYETAKANKTN